MTGTPIAGLAAFGMVVVLFATVSRLPTGGGSVLRFVAVAAAGGCGLAIQQFATQGIGVTMLAVLALYAFLVELYLFAFTMVSSSVSVSVLLALQHESVTEADIEERYGTRTMVNHRLTKLVANGLLAETECGFELRPVGRQLLGTFAFLRRVFRHAHYQYESP